MDFETRQELIFEIQRDLAPANFISPWIARVGVFAVMPQVQDWYYKSSFRVGTESWARAWLDPSKKL